MSRIPLLPATLEILRRYEHDEVCVARSRVLPTPSNQKMNAYMKEIAAVCGIDKVLTTHCASHIKSYYSLGTRELQKLSD